MTGLVRERPPARRVRVTLTGDAWPLSHCPSLLRVQVCGRTVVVDTAAEGVAVEDVAEERVWTDGDVVLLEGEPWTRSGGRWRGIRRPGSCSDAAVDHDLTCELVSSRVLRYQGGGDA